MGISIMCRVIAPKKDKSLPGLSSDWTTYEETFGRSGVGRDQIPVLRAMHRASVGGFTERKTLWNALADELERLPCGAELHVYAEW